MTQAAEKIKNIENENIESFVSRAHVMKQFGLSKYQIKQWEGLGLPVYGPGRIKFYLLSEVTAFLKSHPQTLHVSGTL